MSVCLYVCAILCASVCVCRADVIICIPAPHYTLLHRSKWVLSMSLHLNYTTEIIGRSAAGMKRTAEEEEEEGEEEQLLHWDQRLYMWHSVTCSHSVNVSAQPLFTGQWLLNKSVVKLVCVSQTSLLHGRMFLFVGLCEGHTAICETNLLIQKIIMAMGVLSAMDKMMHVGEQGLMCRVKVKESKVKSNQWKVLSANSS